MDWLLPELEWLRPYLSKESFRSYGEALAISVAVFIAMRQRIIPWIKTAAETAVKALVGPITKSLDNLAEKVEGINKVMVQKNELNQKRFELIETGMAGLNGRIQKLEGDQNG